LKSSIKRLLSLGRKEGGRERSKKKKGGRREEGEREGEE
jgi:hypothetical protein